MQHANSQALESRRALSRQQKPPAINARTRANEQVLFSRLILLRAGVLAGANAKHPSLSGNRLPPLYPKPAQNQARQTHFILDIYLFCGIMAGVCAQGE
jgi:hypothetical protein